MGTDQRAPVDRCLHRCSQPQAFARLLGERYSMLHGRDIPAMRCLGLRAGNSRPPPETLAKNFRSTSIKDSDEARESEFELVECSCYRNLRGVEAGWIRRTYGPHRVVDER